MANRVRLVGTTLQDTIFNQSFQSVDQPVARDAQARLPLIKPSHAHEGVTDDQGRPAISDHGERACC